MWTLFWHPPTGYILAVREAGAVADDAEPRKRVKYTHLESTHYFIPVAIETLGAMGQEARSFLRKLRAAS